MPQSLSAVCVHLVFSTKDRQPFLTDKAFRTQVHSYLGGISDQQGYGPVLIGGVEDHVHVLARQSRTCTIADWVKHLKTGSTMWIKTQRSDLTDFAWQGGYGVFSVSIGDVPKVRRYIADQEIHHRTVSFKDEYRAILREHNVDFDEKYVWD